MASISTNDTVVAIKKGTTWGTAADVTTGGHKLRVSALTYSAAFEEFLSRDIGFNKKLTETQRLTFSGTISITCDMTFNQAWLAIYGQIMGTAPAPTETTATQGDYRHNIDCADDITGQFMTLVYKIEDDRVIEIPSVKWNELTVQADTNTGGTCQFNGTFDQVIITSPTNTAAELDALTYTEYNAAVFGGANAYCRVNLGSGAALLSTDDKAILGFSMSLKRPIQPQHVLRGANSAYIIEPQDLGILDGQLTLKLDKIDDGYFDTLDHWKNKTSQKAEIFLDGTQIGSGVNRSLKWQFPALEALAAMPAGHDIANNNSLMTPTITYRTLKRSAAPTGMTGVTDLHRLVSIDKRATSWIA